MKLKTIKYKVPTMHHARLITAVVLVAGLGGLQLITASHAASSTQASLHGDMNGDGAITIRDVSILLSQVGTSNTRGDLDNNGSVTPTDVAIMLSHFSNGRNNPSPSTSRNAASTPKPTSTTTTAAATPSATPTVGGTTSTSNSSGRGVSAPPPSAPSGISRLFVLPNGRAAQQAQAWRGTRPADAATMDKLAAQPTFMWLGGYSNEETRLANALAGANSANARLQIALYGIPFRDGGSYSSGGFANGAQYKAWIDRIAGRIGGSATLIVLEPDAVAMSIPAEMQAERWDALNYAITRLQSLPNTLVYLDAGTAGWKTPAAMIPRLKAAGVERADGFAVNVSNFVKTDASIAYGRAISAGIGGKPFVIDTSRNGNGTWDAPSGTTDTWCNPPGRAVGSAPTLQTGIAGVDAFLWVKVPGESDGACRGNPSAGTWMPEYALEMARNARW
jgi:endoglucanase